MVSAFKRNREKAKAATAYSEMLEGQSREHSSRWEVANTTVINLRRGEFISLTS